MSKSEGAPAPRLDLTHLLGGPRVIAKRMLKKLRAGDPTVVSNFERLHPRWEQIREQPKLADAQLVLARLYGYRSWPQLKHHHEALARSQREIDEGAPAPDQDLRTVHVRCGSDIEKGLSLAGYVGDFLEVADPFCQGPVPAGDWDSLLETRASFIAHAYELELDECHDRLRREWAALEAVGRYERVVLWFEHDSYDQLILAAVLARLVALEHPRVELICVEEYPGRPSFRGLGELREAPLRALWETRRAVGPDEYRLGAAAWSALRRPAPDDLFEHMISGTPAIPPMAGAIRRHLMELPWVGDGLSLTQRLTLETVRAGTSEAGLVFRTLVNTLDPRPFLGDAMFAWELRELAAGGGLGLTPTAEPWPRWSVSLTSLGEAILEGREDWVEAGQRTRWVGGIRCSPGRSTWRWDPERRRPVRFSV